MEAIADVVASSCPLAFHGASGKIFLNAVIAVITAYCALLIDYRWPNDKADEIIKKATERVSYDFIVVGAGTAGSLVAGRLSSILNKSSVLLIEAGQDPGIDSEVPAFLFLNQQSNNDWSYLSERDGYSCLSFRNKSCIWSKGKGMGGSSSINAMLYIRGNPKDFQDWNHPEKNSEWSYDDLKYYYELQEKLLNTSKLSRTNHDGWYTVIDDAWQELGFKSYKYDSNEGLIGTKKSVLLTMNGKRLNTAKFILDQAKDLHVMKSTMVDKVILDKKFKHAKGVIVRHSSGVTLNITVNKEVILSAGTVATPQILMRSGIGIKQHLEEVGIPCSLDLSVGQNLQDHLTVPLWLKTSKHITFTPERLNLFLLEYMLMRTGPVSNIGITDFFGFINTKNSSDQPNIQFHHMYFSKNNGIMLKQYIEGIGYNKEIVDGIIALNNKHDILGIYPTLLHPKSKGEILLKDSHYETKPIIKANYLKHPEDIQTLIEAIEFVHKLEQTEIFTSLDISILELKLPNCGSFKFNTEPYWRCYIRHMATTIYHPVGTAQMGDSDESVVDYKLLVRGINNLRVVDASIMPSIPGANTMATTLAIANKAVDIITTGYSHCKDEL